MYNHVGVGHSVGCYCSMHGTYIWPHAYDRDKPSAPLPVKQDEKHDTLTWWALQIQSIQSSKRKIANYLAVGMTKKYVYSK